MRTTRSLACAIGALLILASACSSTSERVSDKIAGKVKDVLDLAAKPTNTCPKDAKSDKGQKFKCVTTIDGQPLTIDVDFTKDNFFTFKPEGNVVKATDLASQIKTGAGAASVTCGPKADPVITTGHPYVCNLKAKDGSAHKITVSWTGKTISLKAD
ncbi:MAG TPA: DUF4333 domain-containing protein [Acidimicrobiales bacterium]